MDTALPLISMITGLGAGTLALIAAGRQPDKALQLRRMGFFFFGLAGVMALMLVL